MQIEKTESWGYWSRVLKIIKLTKEEVKQETVAKAVEKINDEAGQVLIDDTLYRFIDKSKELYTFLIPKLNCARR